MLGLMSVGRVGDVHGRESFPRPRTHSGDPLGAGSQRGRPPPLMASWQLWVYYRLPVPPPDPTPMPLPPRDISLYLVSGAVPRVEPGLGRLGGALVWPPFLLGL